MRSMFVSAPFSRYDLGREALTGGGNGLPRLGLGSIFTSIENVFSNKSKLTAGAKDCESKKGTDKILCYSALAEQAVKGGDTSSTTPTLQPIAPVQPPSSFPIIPVLLATAGAGALIWFLVYKGKKNK